MRTVNCWRRWTRSAGISETARITAQDPAERGAGDISFVAEGLASLDGLGASGDNEHAPGEYVDLAHAAGAHATCSAPDLPIDALSGNPGVRGPRAPDALDCGA